MLRENNLIGNIPPTLGNLTHLQHITVEHNALSGVFPVELGKLKNLEVVAIARNQISGTLSVGSETFQEQRKEGVEWEKLMNARVLSFGVPER